MSFDSSSARGGFRPSRRRFVQGLAAGGAVAGLGLWPRSGWALKAPGQPQVLSGTDFDLTIGEIAANYTGRVRTAVAVNGSIPAPLLRWREGTTVELRVRNALPPGSAHGEVTSIHWHGILLPANMDGVPGMSFAGIHRGETYRYRFEVRQGGTYWYHSHSGFQEQAGLYGPLVIDPIEPEPFAYDRDYVVLLSDWTDLDPAALFARLKKMPGHDNYYRRTVGDFLRDARRDGLAATVQDRRAWGGMRMTPSDLSDVNAHTYTYLMNGTTSLGNWTGLFRSGEKVRLRFINGSSMTHFDVRIPGLKMTVVAADGQYVHPVTVDEFRIAAAETYDVIVEPSGQDAFAIFCQDMGRTGYVSGTLAVREGLRAPVPAPDPRPLLSMADMGHGGGGTDAAHAPHPGHAGMDHGAHAGRGGHAGHGAGMQAHPASEAGNPLVDMQTMAPAPRLDDPGIGLRDTGRRALSYAMLRSLFEDPDGREPGREIELHLTGHMERFAWGFDGLKFSDARPLRFNYGERLRIVLVNDTMMTHPIHLHGMWSDLEDERGEFLVRKHTVDMPPGSRRSYRVRADALGSWAYHCHLLYHMEAGMMREVRVDE
ncbi:copper resistance system multicopper oxidase [Vulcaniibacterium tengchongense]|uniref:CopA family copper-resistance protein n=1 Tax=Vulcaniibacterium tengchongense TaxID=1273429 RepID=A0A3N4VF76_9GAMM|nr:copper resistance system multicopper oxidase [Vulcaniibacterium tengchongense]RPE81686.1 CopA family copper-resistance protein [Vulcaniibacterium tengchongense]